MSNLTVTELISGMVEITSPGNDPYTVHGELTVRKNTQNNRCGLYNDKGSFMFNLYPSGKHGVTTVIQLDGTAHKVKDAETLYDALILILKVPSEVDSNR